VELEEKKDKKGRNKKGNEGRNGKMNGRKEKATREGLGRGARNGVT
jgi:hypothetical protein